MKSTRQFLMFLVALLVIVVIVEVVMVTKQRSGSDANITSFEECAAAGYPIMETFPEQCRTDSGALFVKGEYGSAVPTGDQSLSGVVGCLPANPSLTEITLECALGLQLPSGEYVALNTANVPGDGQQLMAGSEITATGWVVPAAALSADTYHKYDVAAVMDVATWEVVNPSTPVDAPVQPTTPEPTTPTTPPVTSTEPPATATKQCYVGGCSSQICSDQPGMASTCEWREEYACYIKSICEQQADGECGWTQTDEFQKCVMSANATTLEQ